MMIDHQTRSEPLISVIVPCYNQGEFLNECLTSLTNQTFTNWECIIINDGSTDTTEANALGWCKKDYRFRYCKQANKGLSASRNTGLAIALGQFIQFLDCDDIIENVKLEISVSHLAHNPTSNMVISNFLMCGKTIVDKKPPYCDLSLIQFSFEGILLDWDIKYTIPIHCGFFRSTLLKGFTFNEELKAKEDWLFWLHCFEQKPNFYFINQPLALYRIHGKNMSGDSKRMVENTSNAFELIFKMLQANEYKIAFFKKVNDFWHQNLQIQIGVTKSTTLLINQVFASKSYRIGNLLLRPFSMTKAFARKFKKE